MIDVLIFGLKVTHNQENVVDLQWLESGVMPPEDLDSVSRNLAFHLKNLVDERDTQLEVTHYSTYVMRVLFNVDLWRLVALSLLPRVLKST